MNRYTEEELNAAFKKAKKQQRIDMGFEFGVDCWIIAYVKEDSKFEIQIIKSTWTRSEIQLNTFKKGMCFFREQEAIDTLNELVGKIIREIE